MSDPTRLETASYRAAAGRTLLDLHRAIKARMAEVVAGLPLLATKSDTRAATIGDGWLPPKTLAWEDFPFVLVRSRSGSDAEQSADQASTVAVDLVIGTYSDTTDGWFDVVELIEAIRLSLAAKPVLAGTSFEHTGPLTWQLDEEQARPQWLGKVTTNWTIPRPWRVEAATQGA